MSISLYNEVVCVTALQLLSLGRATRAKGTKDTCFPENVPDDRGLKWTVLEKKRHTDRLQMSSSAAQLHLLLVLLKALAPWRDEHTHLAGFYYSAINKAHQLFGWAGLQLASVCTAGHSCSWQHCVQLFAAFFFFKTKVVQKKNTGGGGKRMVPKNLLQYLSISTFLRRQAAQAAWHSCAVPRPVHLAESSSLSTPGTQFNVVLCCAC